ncbi:hypothetical protein C8Q80DRAFT_1270907 [Daedaleopsis nitida]|nr:hypothetical protein C8Q80DRAFT_1270907 [Daedaleopsis nitida]
MSPEDNNPSAPAPISLAVPASIPSFARSTAPLSFPPSLAPRRAMHPVAFVPRPFPPPALADVPLEYIVDQLRRLATYYWTRPETSDCTIAVPLSYENTDKMLGPSGVCDAFRNMGINSEVSTDSFGLDESPAPALRNSTHKSVRPRRMVMKLHMDYLCAHSALLRGLLSGASPFDLVMDAPSDGCASSHSTPEPSLSRQSSMSTLPVPCILPSSTCSHPVVYLPIPDPASFHYLIHYIYFGSTSFIEEALDNGDLTWNGLASNAEYLQMGADFKLFLGRYWRRENTHFDGSEWDSDCEYDSDYDSDESISEDEDDATLADPDEEEMCLADDEDDMSLIKAKAKAKANARARAREPPRGRERTTRRLGHSTSDPVISHRAAEAGPSTFRRNSSK